MDSILHPTETEVTEENLDQLEPLFVPACNTLRAQRQALCRVPVVELVTRYFLNTEL